MLNFPKTFLIPAANKLLPLLSAFFAPSSIVISPFGEIELIIHFFLACNFDILDINQVQLFFFYIRLIGFKYNPLAMTMLQPAKLQILAASILVFIPPLPNSVIPLTLIF